MQSKGVQYPEEFIKDVTIGGKAAAVPVADNARSYEGKVTRVSNLAVKVNGETVIPVEITLAARDGFLLPNFNVDVQKLILAHDIGTTGDKATLFRSDGTVLASAFAGYPTSYPRPGWAEQNPDDYWAAFCTATRYLLGRSDLPPASIAVISFSGQMMAAFRFTYEQLDGACRTSIPEAALCTMAIVVEF
jgi:hypothetical protein